jgi:hypothetical protein
MSERFSRISCFAQGIERTSKKALLFVNKKQRKNFICSGPWAVSATTPIAQHKKVFAPLFSKKTAIFFCFC